MALGEVLARLSVELGLDTAAFSTGARKASKANKDLGDSAEAMGRRVGAAGKAIAVAGAAVAGAYVLGKVKQLAVEGLEYASSLGEQAQQLGSVGAFGKTFQTNINKPKVPGFAGGTLSAPRGLALVGERGPELVQFGGGERVFPSGTGPAGGRGPITVNVNARDAVLTQTVRGWVQEGVAVAIDGGAQVSARRQARVNQRRLA